MRRSRAATGGTSLFRGAQYQLLWTLTGRRTFTERSLFDHVVRKLAGKKATGEKQLHVWRLLSNFHFEGERLFSEVVGKIDSRIADRKSRVCQLEEKRRRPVDSAFLLREVFS